jgi:hypothetical protein
MTVSNNAGFFPADAANIDRFVRVYLDALAKSTAVGVWSTIAPGIRELAQRWCPEARAIVAGALDPIARDEPWSAALEGKRVLVVHPFASSIDRQYNERRQLLFPGRNVLPQFDLVTVRAIQSIAGTDVGFNSWFDALDYMREQMDQVEYDVAIVGAGAYGLPLAAHALERGRQGVHMGGATQMLFGVLGRRWEFGYKYAKDVVNEWWVRPATDETPENHKAIENGAYW